MARIPFDIKFRPQIESGKYKVETRDGRPARVICWDRVAIEPLDNCNIVALVTRAKSESAYYYYQDGHLWNKANGEGDSSLDLFILTQEPELTEFEKELESFYNHHLQVCTYDNQGTVEDSLHDGASKLLFLARQQFIKDGYVIEKKAFHDSVENISDKHRAEMSVQYSIHSKVEDGTRHAIMKWDTFQKVAQKFIDIGKAEALEELKKNLTDNDIYRVPEWLREVLVMAKENGKKEALKDLPRWKIWKNGACGNGSGIPIAIVKHVLKGYAVVDALGISGEQYIMLEDLEKLPKEEDCNE